MKSICSLKKRFYLFEIETIRENEHESGGGTEGKGQADSSQSREPQMGLYPGTL